ncbi:AAA domain-containing protein [Promicromonospora sp. NPDC057138]|uniref:AAA domain-containing protein n=1 Tax=Promicromonospora sp. NPDC057138 TaxID=3346031 RepID=UPI0036324BF4
MPAEGDAAAWVLRGLRSRHGLQAKDVLVVRPFRAAADRLKPLVRRTFGQGVTSGTVHVSQGKEALAVILVLGGGTQGARSWAASRPNLMNVAISRAKHRLYVVGNRETWQRLPHFEALAARLAVYEYG